MDGIAKANIFFSGENNWHQFDQWPPKNTTSEPWSMVKAGKLVRTSGKAEASQKGYDEYISDPAKPVPYTQDVHFGRTREYMTDDQRFASRRPDVLVYQTEVLDEDITLAGVLTADLLVSTTGTDADFVVKLIDVFPDDFKYEQNGNGKVPMGGYQMLVRAETMRGKFRNSFSKPEPFVPNKLTEVKFNMPDVAHTFKKGHQLMIQIQSTWFPLTDRNPQQFLDINEAKDADFVKETIKVYQNSSKIILPVINR